MGEDLPQGWIERLIGDIAKVVGGGTPKTKDESNFVDKDGIPWITPADLSGYKKIHISHGKRFLSQKGLDTSSATLMPEGTVLFSSRAPVGYVAIASNPIATNQGFKSFVLKEGMDSKYVYYYLRNSKSIAEKLSSGTTFLELSGKNAAKIPIKIPPFPEQKLIADKLDCLLAKVDACKSRLDKVPGAIKRFRQSVLADATSGRLTEDWRASNGIEQNNIDQKAIPDNWIRTKLGQFIIKIKAGKNFKCPEIPVTKETVGLVKISAVTWGEFDSKETKTVVDPEKIIPELFIKENDLLVSRANTIELVGASVIVGKIEHRIMLSDKVWRIDLQNINKAYVNRFLKSQMGRNEIESRATGNQQSMRNISQSAFKDIDINVPPKAEQEEIVKRVDELFSVADQMEEKLKRAQNGVDNLTASILTKAFRGELVPQDTNDEPAEKLLEKTI